MKIVSEVNVRDFQAWSGAVSTLNAIIEADQCEALECYLEELYPDGMTDTQFNDLLWFEDDWLFEILGISDEDEDEEEDV